MVARLSRTPPNPSVTETIAITGGHGFAGVNAARYFGRRGFAIRAIDIAPRPAMLAEDVVSSPVDVRDAAALRRVFEEAEPRYVLHAAAQLPRSEPEAIRSTTVDGTRNVLAAAAATGVERVAFVSTTAVYPPGAGARHDEDAPLVGYGVYGRAKVEAERICVESRGRGPVVSVIRPRSFVGPYRMGIFQLLFQWIAEGRRIPMVGSGNNRIQLLDVDDLLAGVEAVFAAPRSAADTAFNVGASEFGTVRDDIGALCAHAATGARPIRTPVRPVTGTLGLLNRVGLTPIYPWVVDTAALDQSVPCDRLEALGWRARRSNARALCDAYDHYIARTGDGAADAPMTGHLAPWNAGLIGLVRHLF